MLVYTLKGILRKFYGLTTCSTLVVFILYYSHVICSFKAGNVEIGFETELYDVITAQKRRDYVPWGNCVWEIPIAMFLHQTPPWSIPYTLSLKL